MYAVIFGVMFQIVLEIGVSKSELCHPFVQKGFDKYGEGFEDDEDEEDE